MAGKAIVDVPATPEVVVSDSDVFTIIRAASDMVSQHTDALAALSEAKDDAAWSAAWSAAQAQFVGETNRIDAAVKSAREIVTAGRRASDAHAEYRVQLVGAYVARKGSKVSDAEVSRAVYGEDSNARRKQIGRDRLAIRVLTAATKAKATHSDYIVPSVTQALTAVNRGTVADAKAVVARAGEAQDLLPESDPKPVKAPALIRKCEDLLDAVKRLDSDSLTDETAATLVTLLQRIGEAHTMVNVTVGGDAATSTK